MRSCSFSEAGVVATVRLGLIGGIDAVGIDAVWKRPMSPQAASEVATNSRAGAAQSRRLIPHFAPSRKPIHLKLLVGAAVISRLSGGHPRPALRSAPPVPPRSVGRGAPRPSHEHESADSPVT